MGHVTREVQANASRRERSPVEVGAAAHGVVCEMLLALLVAEVLQRVGPEQVAHGPVRRRLLEAVQLRKDMRC